MPLFHAPENAGFRLLIKPQYDRRHPTTGDIIETDQAIWAEFGKFGEVQTFMNPETGESHSGAQVIGHYYDTDTEAVERNWSQETHDLVVRRLRDAARREPYRVVEIERTVPKAALPWPTYDDCDTKTVLELAPALGLVTEALAYERENRQRPAILDGLADTDSVAAGEEETAGEEVVPDAAVRKAAELLKSGSGSSTITV